MCKLSPLQSSLLPAFRCSGMRVLGIQTGVTYWFSIRRSNIKSSLAEQSPCSSVRLVQRVLELKFKLNGFRVIQRPATECWFNSPTWVIDIHALSVGCSCGRDVTWDGHFDDSITRRQGFGKQSWDVKVWAVSQTLHNVRHTYHLAVFLAPSTRFIEGLHTSDIPTHLHS